MPVRRFPRRRFEERAARMAGTRAPETTRRIRRPLVMAERGGGSPIRARCAEPPPLPEAHPMRLIPLAAVLLLSACSVSVQRTPPPVPDTPEVRVVQAHVDAFNRRDIEAYMATYAPEAIHWEYPDRKVWPNAARIRAHYTELFGDPDASGLHLEVRHRIVKDRFVIDHDFYRGLPGEDTHVSVVIYEVVDGLIRNVWFMN
jgi:hypothetical protein